MTLIKLTHKIELLDLILNGISTEELAKYDYSDITDMSYMFYNCVSLQSVPLFNTSNVTIMRFMFNKCISLTDIDLSLFGLFNFSKLNNSILKINIQNIMFKLNPLTVMISSIIINLKTSEVYKKN